MSHAAATGERTATQVGHGFAKQSVTKTTHSLVDVRARLHEDTRGLQIVLDAALMERGEAIRVA